MALHLRDAFGLLRLNTAFVRLAKLRIRVLQLSTLELALSARLLLLDHRLRQTLLLLSLHGRLLRICVLRTLLFHRSLVGHGGRHLLLHAHALPLSGHGERRIEAPTTRGAGGGQRSLLLAHELFALLVRNQAPALGCTLKRCELLAAVIEPLLTSLQRLKDLWVLAG